MAVDADVGWLWKSVGIVLALFSVVFGGLFTQLHQRVSGLADRISAGATGGNGFVWIEAQ